MSHELLLSYISNIVTRFTCNKKKKENKNRVVNKLLVGSLVKYNSLVVVVII